jgi:hypothetical protein
MAAPKVMTDLEVRLTAQTADLKRKLAEAKKNVGGFTKQMKGLGNTIKGAFAVGAIVAAGKALVNVGAEMSQLAGKAEGIKIAFDKLGVPIEGLRAATKGTVSDLELMRNTVKASEFGIPLENMGKLMEFASVQAQKLGETSDSMLDSLIGSLSTQSKMRLDNLGISMSSMNKEMAKGKDFSQAAFTMINAKLAEGNGLLETSAVKVARWATMWENAKVSIGTLINKGLDALAPVVDKIIQGTKQFFTWVRPKIIEFINGWIMLYNKSMIFRGAVELIKLSFKNAWTVTKTFFLALWETLKGTADLLAFVFNPANWFEDDFLGGLVDKWKEMATGIGDVVIKGAKETAQNYKDAWNNTLNAEPVELLIVPKTESGAGAATTAAPKAKTKKKFTLDESFKQQGILSDEEIDKLVEQEEKNAEKIAAQQEKIKQSRKEQMLADAEEMASTADQANQLIQQTAAAGLVTIGESIGNAIAGIGSGMKTGFQAVIMILLDFAASFGKMLISLGVASMGLKKLIANPVTAIAAGVALVALATAGKAAVQKSMDKKLGGQKGFANGGIVPNSGLFTVGERGKETVALPKGSRVMSNAATKNAMGSGQAIHITGNFEASGENLNFVIDEYKRKQANTI